MWKLRRAIDWRRLLPFLIGGQIGVPLGIEVLRLAAGRRHARGIGAFLIAFSLYSLLKPTLPAVKGARPIADGGVGVLSGIVGGATGLAGILPTIWSTLRGWTKDEQRAVFQPAAVAIFAGTALWLGGTASIDRPTPSAVRRSACRPCCWAPGLA